MKSWLLLLVLCLPCASATYYVDFDGGDDTGAGTNAATAWKHIPGDPNDSGVPHAVSLAGGDVILLKGGVTYRGSSRFDYYGSNGNPITIKGDGWGSPNAIISAGEIITNVWTQCTNAADARGNVAYTNVWWVSCPTNVNYFTTLWSGTNQLFFSQEPNPSDYIFWQELSEWRKLDKLTNRTILTNITQTYICDSNNLIQADAAFYDGSFVGVWVSPNLIEVAAITNYNPTTHTIGFSLSSDLYPTNYDEYYKIIGHPAFLDNASEYAVMTNEDRIYLYSATQPTNMEIARRGGGIFVVNGGNLLIEGIKFIGQCQGQSGYGDGAGLNFMPDFNWRVTNFVCRNIEFTFCRGVPTPTYALQTRRSADCVLSNLTAYNCLTRGLTVSGTNATISSNHIFRVTGAGIYTGGGNQTICRNWIEDVRGIHANGLSTYGIVDSSVYDNVVLKSYRPHAISSIGNQKEWNNIYDARGYDNCLIDQSGNTGTNWWINNVFLGDPNGVSFAIKSNAATHYVFNNFIQGAYITSNATYEYNIWTGLSWQQASPWTPGIGELIQSNTLTLMVDPTNGDYHLASGSEAIAAGTNMSGWGFSAYDAESKYRGTNWDVGPLEYVGEAIIRILSVTGSVRTKNVQHK